jgi:hypothetical protein
LEDVISSFPLHPEEDSELGTFQDPISDPRDILAICHDDDDEFLDAMQDDRLTVAAGDQPRDSLADVPEDALQDVMDDASDAPTFDGSVCLPILEDLPEKWTNT